MPLILTSGPAVEPISLDESKLHCRVDGDAEDLLVSSLILAARLHIERSLDLALISQGWSLYLDCWPGAPYVELPLAPLIGVEAVRLYSPTDSFVTLDPGLFVVDTISRRPRLARRDGQSTPFPGRSINGIEIAFTAGYGEAAEDVPMPVRQALRMLVAHWYEAREPVLFGETADPVPASVASLIAPYRGVKL
jgi:uncharacterized phiE125 gp8 family phage protein